MVWHGLQTPESQLAPETLFSLWCVSTLIPEQHHIKCPCGTTPQFKNTKPKPVNNSGTQTCCFSSRWISFEANYSYFLPSLVNNAPDKSCLVKVGCCPSFVLSLSPLHHTRTMHIPFHISPEVRKWLCMTSYIYNCLRCRPINDSLRSVSSGYLTCPAN